ncbi:alpha/beta hydrolase [Nonlabens sp.]|uniref:alpha/beta fold hydrolase n=1 Tax=Nonlabens sp. TaxID=1888209 RepID=UPI00260365FD|nr:alpha/beta hydrolase [Nonlabens sp.]
MKHLYFMPGMAAGPSIFEHIQLPENDFTCHYLEWIIPENKERLTSYVSRLLQQVTHTNPVLIGVSFGGIIVQEMAKQINVDQLILISTVKSNQEFPRRMRFSRMIGLHKMFPTRLVESFEVLSSYSRGVAPKKIERYKKYLSVNSSVYLEWALDTIVNWDQKEPLPGVIHIHGDADPVFPIKYIKNCIIIPKGTHVMIVNRYRWFNEHLPELIRS